MDTQLKCVCLCIAGALVSLVVRRNSQEFAALIGIGVILMTGVFVLQLLDPVMTFAQSLQEKAKLSRGVYIPVLKTLAIGLIGEIGKNICEDAGEKAIGGVLQLSSGIAAFYVMLPLLQSLLDLLDQIL